MNRLVRWLVIPVREVKEKLLKIMGVAMQLNGQGQALGFIIQQLDTFIDVAAKRVKVEM